MNFCKKCGDCGECVENKYFTAFHGILTKIHRKIHRISYENSPPNLDPGNAKIPNVQKFLVSQYPADSLSSFRSIIRLKVSSRFNIPNLSSLAQNLIVCFRCFRTKIHRPLWQDHLTSLIFETWVWHFFVPTPLEGGGTIYSTGFFFVQSILADRYIHRRELRLVSSESFFGVKYGIKKIFLIFVLDREISRFKLSRK